MKRYVDVDELKENICKRVNNLAIRGWLNRLIDDTSTTDVEKAVRCKDCRYFQDRYIELPDGSKRPYEKGENIVPLSVGINVGSYCKRIDYAIVHGHRDGEPSVDETRLWTKPDDFCSYGERKDEE